MPIQQSGYSDLGVEVENLGRIYKIRGGKKRRTAPKELLALQGVNPRVKQDELFWAAAPNWCREDNPHSSSFASAITARARTDRLCIELLDQPRTQKQWVK